MSGPEPRTTPVMVAIETVAVPVEAPARRSGRPTAVSRTVPPLGCDPAFSKVAEPQKAHIFGRCAA